MQSRAERGSYHSWVCTSFPFFRCRGCIPFYPPESFPFVMVPVYRLKLTAQSPSRYGLLRNLLISCKIPYGRLDTIEPELRKKRNKKQQAPGCFHSGACCHLYLWGLYRLAAVLTWGSGNYFATTSLTMTTSMYLPSFVVAVPSLPVSAIFCLLASTVAA